MDEFLGIARPLSAADAFSSDAVEQAPLHVFSGVETARVRSGQVHVPGRMMHQQVVAQDRDLVGGRRCDIPAMRWIDIRVRAG